MSIFTTDDATALINDRLLRLAATIMPDAAYITPDQALGALKVAEAEVAKQLRIFLEPTIVVPDDAEQDEVDALDASGSRWHQESASDYGPKLFTGDSWGYLITRQKPIISVQSIKFVYPAPTSSIFTVPDPWIRLDRKYGHIRLVPAAQTISAPLNAFLMTALGGGNAIPMMVQIRYTAGLKDAKNDHPDLIDVIKKTAVLKMVDGLFLPQSGSISADGLSQSLSMDTSKYRDVIDRVLFGPTGSNGGLFAFFNGVNSIMVA